MSDKMLHDGVDDVDSSIRICLGVSVDLNHSQWHCNIVTTQLHVPATVMYITLQHRVCMCLTQPVI